MRKLFVKKANNPSNEKEAVHARTYSELPPEKTLKRASTMPSGSGKAVTFHLDPSHYASARKPAWKKNKSLKEQHISLVKEKPSKTNLLDKPQASESDHPSKPVWTSKGKLRDQKISLPSQPEDPNLSSCGLVEFSTRFEEPNPPPSPPPKEPHKPRESFKGVHNDLIQLSAVSASSESLSLYEEEPFSLDWLSGSLLDMDTFRKPPILLPEPTGPLSSTPRQCNPSPFPLLGSRDAVPPEDLLPEYSRSQLASMQRIIKQSKEEAEEDSDEERLRDRHTRYAKIRLSANNIRNCMKFGAGVARQMSRNKAAKEEILKLMSGPAHEVVLEHSNAAAPQYGHIHEGSQDSTEFFAIPVVPLSTHTRAEHHQHSHNASRRVHHRGESQTSTLDTANPAIPVNTHVRAHSEQPVNIAFPRSTPSLGGSQASRDPFDDDKAPQQSVGAASITIHKPTVPLKIPLQKIRRSPSTTNIGWPLPLQPYPSRHKDPSTEVPIYPHLRSDGSMEVKTDKDMPPSTQERYKGKITKLKPSPPLEFGCPGAVPPNPRYYRDKNGEFRSYAQTHRLSVSLGHNTRRFY